MTPPPASPSEAVPARILVVDDEEIVLVALRDLLRRQGYEVATATGVLQALELLKRQAFTVVLTDQQMPTLTGLEFLAEVKRLQPDASRILITAVLGLNTVIDAINKAEIFRFVIKPWQREELLQAVHEAVERGRAGAQCKQSLAEALARNETLSQQVLTLERELALRTRNGS